MKNIYTKIVTGLITLSLVALFVPQSSHASFVEVINSNGKNTQNVTGTVISSSTIGLDVNIASNIAGERNPDSATNSYMVVRDEVNMTIISTTSTSTIGGGAAGDTHLVGLQISTALTGVCVIGGFGDTVGSSTSFIMPVGSVGYKEFKGAKNNIGALTVTCPTAGDDNFVAVFWRPV